MRHHRLRGMFISGLGAAVVLGLATAPAAAQPGPDHEQGRLSITTVDNPRPSLISGNETLIGVTAPNGTRDVRITANGHDVTSAFRAQSDGSLLGLVTGLREGRNELVATDRGQRAELTVDDHPVTGPVFSGPQQVPFFCETTAFGLAPAVMPLCGAPTVVTYEYKNTSGAFVALADPTSRPADLATASVDGRTVPYIVRVETGTIDRAVYQLAALYDGTNPSPLVPDANWNHTLVYTFGGGCNAGYHQGNSTGGVLDDLFLSQGYAVASSSLNVLDNNCSTVISADATIGLVHNVAHA